MAQAIVIISGGIDLSVGSMMSLINVLSAVCSTPPRDRRSRSGSRS
jgi:ribose/xylose/arabinose/galactoside ABC-type transport system permease subunit